MSTLSVKCMRLSFLLAAVLLSGCSIFTPKPVVVDTQADVLGPIPAELQDEEYESAEELLLEVTQKFPGFAGPWANLAIAQSKQEKYDAALISIDSALQQDENFCQAVSLKGVVLRELGQFKQAKDQYLSALSCNPNDIMTLYNIGVLSDLYLHDNVTALSYYQKYLAALGEQQDETVQSWVVDLKRRVPAESQQEPVQNIETAVDANSSAPQLAGEE